MKVDISVQKDVNDKLVFKSGYFYFSYLPAAELFVGGSLEIRRGGNVLRKTRSIGLYGIHRLGPYFIWEEWSDPPCASLTTIDNDSAYYGIIEWTSLILDIPDKTLEEIGITKENFDFKDFGKYCKKLIDLKNAKYAQEHPEQK